MTEEKSYSMEEMAQKKFELVFDQVFSFSQLYDLKKVRRETNTLWKENRELFDYLERARLFSLLIDKEELWKEWWEENKFGIGYKKIDEFLKKLKYKICAFCGNPFTKGNINRIYCKDTCKQYAYNNRQAKKLTNLAGLEN